MPHESAGCGAGAEFITVEGDDAGNEAEFPY
jgi:hypothetical protein